MESTTRRNGARVQRARGFRRLIRAGLERSGIFGAESVEFRAAGVVFVEANGEGPGVRLRKGKRR
jgi:hypothetical protein